MKRRTISLSVWVVFVMITLVACGSVDLFTINPKTNQAPALPAAMQAAPAPSQGPVPSGASGDLLAAYQGTLENIYTMVSPSVVNVRVVQKVDASSFGLSQMPGFPFFSPPQGQQPQQQYQSVLGSGFVWDQSGDIVTNNHVISGADKIEVTFSDGTTVPATLVGADPDSDLAVVQVEVAAAQLHPVQLADSSAVKVGQLAIAIGNPFGLEGTMTTGIISAVGRSLPADDSSNQSYTIPDVIQTDAPINPGNSGGVLVDAQGQVLGISGTTLVPDLAKAMKLDAGQRGALVEEIFPNSPAEKAGLRGSSQQVNIDGQTAHIGGTSLYGGTKQRGHVVHRTRYPPGHPGIDGR